MAVAAGVTAFLALAGAGVALAAGGGGTTPGASLSASTSTSTSLPPGHRQPHMGKMPLRMGGPDGALGRNVLHGEFTVQSGGTYRTYDVQFGRVGDVSASSITVTSADGFTQSYAVQTATIVDSQAGGISAVTGKDTVMVRALVEGKARTATDIVDTTKVKAGRHAFGPQPPAPRPGSDPPAAAA